VVGSLGSGLSLVFQISKPTVPILALFFKFKNLWAQFQNMAQFQVHIAHDPRLEII
jgi:hypothetical protein